MTVCELCGEPMPAGEEMFKYHGLSGDCPKPPRPRTLRDNPVWRAALRYADAHAAWHHALLDANAKSVRVGNDNMHDDTYVAPAWERRNDCLAELARLLGHTW